MLKFSARYARKVQYYDISCRARRKNCNFSDFCPTNPKYGSTPLEGGGAAEGRSLQAHTLFKGHLISCEM